jgi:hypothetical protein
VPPARHRRLKREKMIVRMIEMRIDVARGK